MNLRQIRLAKALTVLGAVPFLAAVAARLYGLDALHIRYFSLSYGAVIASFLSGMHWGLYLTNAQATRTNLLVTSNLFALLAWASLIVFSVEMQYLIQVFCFSGLLLIDRKLTNDGILERWFYELRIQISLVVVLCQLTLLGLSLI